MMGRLKRFALYLNFVLPFCVLHSYEFQDVAIFEVTLESSDGEFVATVERVHLGDKLRAEKIVSRRLSYYEKLFKLDTRLLIYHYSENTPFSKITERERCVSWKIDEERVVFVSEEGKKLIPLNEFIRALIAEGIDPV